MEEQSLASGGGWRCRALLAGPDPPPPRLGPCKTVWIPVYRAVPIAGSAAQALSKIESAEVVVFTSPRAPRFLAFDANSHGLAWRLRALLRGTVVGAVGPATAASVKHSLDVEASIVPRIQTGSGLAYELANRGYRRVAWVRGYPAGRGLRDGLMRARVDLAETIVYALLPTGLEGLAVQVLKDGAAEYLVATSPSIARLISKRLGTENMRARIVAIGPTTARALTSKGMRVDCVPEHYDLGGVAACINQLETASPTGV